MLEFNETKLENGLQIISHEDNSSPNVIFNILYKVGSRDENENKTGLAHFFEHLMFGGSKNVPNYDTTVERVGGSNNAFTSTDITNYYVSLPSDNIDTAFWVESDRMLSPNLSEETVEVQRKVVIEEFKQQYLNKPYGDAMLKLRALAYEKHPYRWATIGKEISHIESFTNEDVSSFFSKFYSPNNAVLVTSGNLSFDKVANLAEKWFGTIPKGEVVNRNFSLEEKQSKQKRDLVKANVPSDAIYIAFRMSDRRSDFYFVDDLLSDIVGRGKSSRLYATLVKEKRILSSVDSYVTGSIDPGLIIITGKVNPEFSLEIAEKEIFDVLRSIQQSSPIQVSELEKVKNQAESSLLFSRVGLMNRAVDLAYASFLGNAGLVNEEADKTQKVSVKEVNQRAKEIFKIEESAVLLYQKS